MSIIQAQFCQSNEPFHQMLIPSRSREGLIHTVTVPFPEDPRDRWYCSCEGWTHRGKCQHLAMLSPCRWDQVTGPEEQNQEQVNTHVCPRCGGPTYDDLVEAE